MHRLQERMGRMCALLLVLIGLVSMSGSGTAAAARGSSPWVGAHATQSIRMVYQVNARAGLGLHDGRYATLHTPGTAITYSYSPFATVHELVCVYYRTPAGQPPSTLRIVVTDRTTNAALTQDVVLRMQSTSRTCVSNGAAAISTVMVQHVDGPAVEIDAIEGYVGQPIIDHPHADPAVR